MSLTPQNIADQPAAAYGRDMEARLAVLEQIAADTKDMLGRIDGRMNRIEDRMVRLEDRQASDFKWLLATGMAATGFLFAAMAHGFHWL